MSTLFLLVTSTTYFLSVYANTELFRTSERATVGSGDVTFNHDIFFWTILGKNNGHRPVSKRWWFAI